MTQRAGLDIADQLAGFLEQRALPGTGVDRDAFWTGMADLFARFAPENRDLLARRDALQHRIDDWYAARAGQHDGPRLVRAGARGGAAAAARRAVPGADALLTPVYQSDSRVIPALRDRLVANAGMTFTAH